jgi:hypothetical protein
VKRDSEARADVHAFMDVNRTDYTNVFVLPFFLHCQTMRRIVLSMPTSSQHTRRNYVVKKQRKYLQRLHQPGAKTKAGTMCRLHIQFIY